MKLYDAIGFDLDGTLWDSAAAVVPGWNEVLTEENRPYHITVEDIYGIMGLTTDKIGQKLFPDLDPKEAEELARRCCIRENDHIIKTGGILFPDLEYVLETLSKKYKLYIVSNCESGYIEAFLGYHKEVAPYISDFTCLGHTGNSKGENIKLVLERNGWKNSIYVGDTDGDRRAAESAGLPFIHASYGFGNAERVDYRIGALKELLEIL